MTPRPWNQEAYDCYAYLTGDMTQYFFATVPPATAI